MERFDDGRFLRLLHECTQSLALRVAVVNQVSVVVDVDTNFISKELLVGPVGEVHHVALAKQVADQLQIYRFDVFCHRIVLPIVAA